MLQYAVRDASEFSEEDYLNSYRYMDKTRKRKVERVQKECSKKSTLAGEWMVRQLLSQVTGESKEAFVILEDEKGKPYVQNVTDIFFNISHSDTKIAVAVSDEPVGVDIEILRPRSLKIAQKVCTPEELLYVFGHEPSKEELKQEQSGEILRRFLEIWTVKEAYFKCIGTGITDFFAVNAFSEEFQKKTVFHEEYILNVVTVGRP